MSTQLFGSKKKGGRINSPWGWAGKRLTYLGKMEVKNEKTTEPEARCIEKKEDSHILVPGNSGFGGNEDQERSKT